MSFLLYVYLLPTSKLTLLKLLLKFGKINFLYKIIFSFRYFKFLCYLHNIFILSCNYYILIYISNITIFYILISFFIYSIRMIFYISFVSYIAIFYFVLLILLSYATIFHFHTYMQYIYFYYYIIFM